MKKIILLLSLATLTSGYTFDVERTNQLILKSDPKMIGFVKNLSKLFYNNKINPTPQQLFDACDSDIACIRLAEIAYTQYLYRMKQLDDLNDIIKVKKKISQKLNQKMITLGTVAMVNIFYEPEMKKSISK